MDLIRWILAFPLGVIGGVLTGGFLLQPTNTMKWLLLIPSIFFSLFMAIGLIGLFMDYAPPVDFWEGEDLFVSLSPWWKTVLYSSGVIVGTIYAMSQSKEELAD